MRWPLSAAASAAAVAFVVLFWNAFTTLGRDWWNDPDAGHGLLLAPAALYLAWKAGIVADRRPRPILGSAILVAAVALRFFAGLAAELFTLRASMLAAILGIVVFYVGVRQVVRWWLPFVLVALSVPLPSVVLGTLALPLQLQASEMGAALLQWRDVPVMLAGNVIHLPGQSLFVTEACSGLRSLTALLALGFLMGGLWLRHPVARLAVVALAIPIAVLLNGVRVFLTGFLVYFVNPELGDGFMHYTEGWMIFLFAFVMLGALTFLLVRMESFASGRLGRTAEVAA